MSKALNNHTIAPSSKPTRSASGDFEIKDPSSSKHVHFVNTITLIPPHRNDMEEESETFIGETSDIKEETTDAKSENWNSVLIIMTNFP